MEMIAPLVVLVAGLVATCSAHQPENSFSWRRASDPGALCNDYTRAGFFLNRNHNSSKWVIFLESGSLCYSNATCNRRFFGENIRKQENSNNPGVSADFPYGRFDTSNTYSNIRANNVPYYEFVNPLMTSMECLRSRFPEDFSVHGRDIMDGDPTKNPDFFSHNHVIIPYCSSDLWLGDEIQGPECNCSDLECFNYQPNSFNLQFTFRGKKIFQSIFKQLQMDYGMDNATEVVIAGSSAGGVGAINHAQWVRDQLLPETKLLVLLDSSWFINFQESIYRIFDGTVNAIQSTQLNTDSRRLLDVLSNNPSCRDLYFGYPCCISAHCVLTRRNSTGQLAYYPETNQKTFAIFSLYDVFLLAPEIAGQDSFTSSDNESPNGDDADDVNLAGLLINFLRIIGEYGGEMNSTASMSYYGVSFLSYYSTQCFQHVYLATSDLWGKILFSSTEESSDLTSFTHYISSGRWSGNPLAANSSSNLVTMQEAVSEWYRSDERKRYTAACQGPYCTEECPDEFVIIELNSNNWPNFVKFVIIVVSFAVPMACIVMKTLFIMWLFILERKQLAYLNPLHDSETGRESKLQLLECSERDKISVSCLNLSYSITYKVTKLIKDETKDETKIVALHDIPEELIDKEEEKVDQKQKKSTFRTTFRHSNHHSLGHHQHKPGQLLLETIEDNKQPEKKIEGVKDKEGEVNDTFVKCFREYTTKEILKEVSLYFNPGSMIGLMGPSGCGKTTFLDILTGRRETGKFGGNIYVNGFPLDEAREWYVGNTGYVLQLATPYYAELTVRDNLTLSAHIMLGENVTMKDKFKRVELVMNVTGLNKLADTVVGGDVGPGLSGGQKRRLSVAIQLLKMPSILYLDEPTSGLDATSSLELLYHLDLLAKSGRTVVLTIHQPRMEIFHMFDRLVLLSDGKIAYHGAPEKAYEVFVSALLTKKLNYSSLKEQNPADVIMDILGQPKLRKTILEYYENSPEPNKVRRAVQFGINQEESDRGLLRTALFGAKNITKSSASDFVRLAALEARATKRLSLGKTLFLPVMFLVQAIVLGTLYFQRSNPYLIVPAIATFSCASGLYVFPAIELYYSPAIRLFGYEKANGVGKARDLVLQGFIRYGTIAFFPVLMSTTLIYLLLIKYQAYSLLVYLQVLAVNVCLNLTWTALLTALLMTFPTIAFRISSVVSSIAGLASGFLIPIGNIHWGYRWIAYINPNYYALSSVTFFVLEDFDFCEGSQFECFFDSGAYILRMFFFDKINPYLHLVVLMLFTAFYLSMAILANWAHHSNIKGYLRRIKHVFIRMYRGVFPKKDKSVGRQFKRHKTIQPEPQQSGKKSGWTRLKEALAREGLSRLTGESYEDGKKRGLSFLTGDESHKVWRPKFSLADIVAQNMKERVQQEQQQEHSKEKPPKLHSSYSAGTLPLENEKLTGETSLSVKSFQVGDRKKTLMKRVNFAWKVLQENPATGASEDSAPKPTVAGKRWKTAAKKLSHEESVKKQTDFSLIVAGLIANEKETPDS